MKRIIRADSTVYEWRRVVDTASLTSFYEISTYRGSATIEWSESEEKYLCTPKYPDGSVDRVLKYPLSSAQTYCEVMLA